MNTKLPHLLVFFLALLALFVIGYDYISGHTIDEILGLEYCPVCDTFRSAGKVFLIFFALLLQGMIVLLGFAHVRTVALSNPLHETLFALRAPPAVR